MSTVFDFFAQPELPVPTLPVAEARELLAATFGMTAELLPLGSQQDQNFLLREPGTARTLGVLKLSNPAFSDAEIDLQTTAARLVAEANPDLRVAAVVEGANGPMDASWTTDGGRLRARVLEYVEGATLGGPRYLSPAAVARLGELAGRVSLALKDLDDAAADRVLQWDLRHARRVIDLLAGSEPDLQVRDDVLAAASTAGRLLAAVENELPLQIGHFDLTDDNVMAPHAPVALPDAIIDFGDVMRSWRVAELAVTISCVLHHDGATPLSVLPAVRAFHTLRPLTPAEADALWPLVVLRGAVLVLSGRQQVRLDADNAYVLEGMESEQRILDLATSVPAEVMAGVIRHELGLPAPERPVWQGDAVVDLSGRVEVLDTSTVSPLFDEGAWPDPTVLDREATRLLDEGADAVVVPFGATVLAGSPTYSSAPPATVTTGVTLWLQEPKTIREQPLSGGPTLLRDHAHFPRASGESVPDHEQNRHPEPLEDGVIPARTRIRVQVVPPGQAPAPFLVEAGYRRGWEATTIDPARALGLVTTTSSIGSDLLQRRERHVAGVQEHYYAEPPQVERGWREHLIDTDGRVYLDMVNNVTSVGHAHPRLVEAAHRQMRLLNTNSRFNYEAVATFAERITATLPDELDTVFFVNSGSEAADLAIRLAMAATGRTDIVAMREAYHGWTYAGDAVSTSVADNPNALATRPSWVHTVEAANSYRGLYRGDDAWRYADEAVAKIREVGHRAAGFMAESYFGNAGGIALPDGYLKAVYQAVREAGGLAIADEVQVGYGRLGHWFWGFEQQDVVPDIVAVAKSAGSGHPVGAVVTTRAIADCYRTGGYFFSSTGGSPVSSVIGTTVLDIIQSEQLQRNALDVGGEMDRQLRELGDTYPIVGAVHGHGLYLGLEFVRDRETLEPATEETAAICDRLLGLGVFMQPTGDHQNVLKIKPPLCLSEQSATYFVDALERVLRTGW
ncbi:aminotransferase [Kineosporia mesophila]|nr:aminotransferase [Kineosporia mesophila]MCD5355043.1 aminotransferase [Kineosporia mesophila]